MKNLERIKVKDFNLEETLNSGQFFYFQKIDDFFYIINGSSIIKIKQEKDCLIYLLFNTTKEDMLNFFGLNYNLKEKTNDFKNDKYLELAKEKYWGLRLQKISLHQTIISFICSSASNIPKIKKNIFYLSKLFGEKVIFETHEFYLFPEIGKIDNFDKIKEAKTGFRAKYIYGFNQKIKENPMIMDNLKQLDYKEAKKELMKFSGIGSKVANCICLFGLGKEEVFPIDTWVKQLIEDLYLKREAKNIKEIENFINSYFKINKGIKQQYLFHWYRNKGK